MENADSRFEEVQQTVDEVKVIMQSNLSRVEERSGKLEELDTRADLLRTQSKKFSKTAVKVKQRKWWQNLRMKVLLVAIVLVLVLAVIIIIAVVSSGGTNTQEPIQHMAMTTPSGTLSVGEGGKE